MTGPRSANLAREIGASARLLAGLRRFLARPLGADQARDILRRRLENRNEAFFGLLRDAVFGNAASPYLTLFREARCELGDVVAGVRRHGLESELRRLRDAGVHVATDEFKGRRPLVRGGVDRVVSPEDFDSPRGAHGLPVGTGGSTGDAVRTKFELDHLAARAVYDRLMFTELDLDDVPLALWYPQLPAITGVSNSLRYAKLGHPPRRWFDLLAGTRSATGWDGRLLTTAVVLASRLSGRALSRPEPTGGDRVDDILDWIRGRLDRGGRCALQSYVSRVVRVARAAARRGLSLAGTQFIVGSEPLTPARREEIRSSGAEIYERYMAAEPGTIGLSCPDRGDLHLVSDSIAIVPPPDEEGPEAPFLLTSLLGTTPKIMVNVALGDSGTIERASCGCSLHALGLRTHLSRIRRTDAVTCEGMTIPTADLVDVVESDLRPRYGGGTLDFQWVERQAAGTLVRLILRASPGLGALDEAGMVRHALQALARRGRGHRLMASALADARAVEIAREEPRPTPVGKQLPFVREVGER